MTDVGALIDTLHTSTHGVQDVAIEKVLACKKFEDGTIGIHPIYTHVYEHKSYNICGTGELQSYVINPYLGKAVANIHILGNNWSDATLKIGERITVDRIKFSHHGNSFNITDEGRCLPFVDHQDFLIKFKGEHNSSIIIEYDIVEIPELPTTAVAFSFKSNFYSDCYGSDKEILSTGINKVRLYFCHPIESIHIEQISGCVDSISFVVGGD